MKKNEHKEYYKFVRTWHINFNLIFSSHWLNWLLSNPSQIWPKSTWYSGPYGLYFNVNIKDFITLFHLLGGRHDCTGPQQTIIMSITQMA